MFPDLASIDLACWRSNPIHGHGQGMPIAFVPAMRVARRGVFEFQVTMYF